MNAHPVALEEATIRQQCKALHMPTVGAQCSRLAEQAVKERQPYLRYLEALLSAELDERERNVVQRRIREAHLPRLKALEDFDFPQCPKVSAAQVLRDCKTLYKLQHRSMRLSVR